jgi:hypothetical protein
VTAAGSNVQRKSPGAPEDPRRGPTTGAPLSRQGPAGVGAVAMPMALSFGSPVTVVSVTT